MHCRNSSQSESKGSFFSNLSHVRIDDKINELNNMHQQLIIRYVSTQQYSLII